MPRKPIPAAESLAPLPFPEKGLDVNMPLSLQPPLTTSTGSNCRLYENLTQRARGGSRSGLSKYFESQINSGLTPIQDLATVVHLDEQATGAANYQGGDPAWTQIAHAGTYVLAYTTGSGFKMSSAMGVDTSGNVRVGTPLPGTPSGGDGFSSPAILLGSPLALPANTYVLAYWQPGAFQLDPATDWQDGPLFPGFGWMQANFPGGSIANNFGFPTATTPAYTVPSGTIPDAPFWDWPSGYLDIDIEITFQRACAIQVSALMSGAANNPPSLNFTVTLNGTFSFRGTIIGGAGLDPGGRADVDFTIGGPHDPGGTWLSYNFYLLTNDARPNVANSSNFQVFSGVEIGPVATGPYSTAIIPPGALRRGQANQLTATVTVLSDNANMILFSGLGVNVYTVKRFNPVNSALWRWANPSSGATDGLAGTHNPLTLNWTFP